LRPNSEIHVYVYGAVIMAEPLLWFRRNQRQVAANHANRPGASLPAGCSRDHTYHRCLVFIIIITQNTQPES